MYGFLKECPPWYTPKSVESFYENDQFAVWWNIPEFAEADSEVNANDLKRPDGKIMIKSEKKIFLVEATITWLNNREERLKEKETKYEGIMRNIRRVEEGFEVDQITIVMDSLGGFSKSLHDNIRKVVHEQKSIERIIKKMQKAVLCESSRIARCFKLSI